MKMILHTKIGTEQLYSTLVKSLLYDAGQKDNNEKRKVLKKGYTYKKQLYTKMGSIRNVSIEVVEVIENGCIAFNVLANNGCTHIRYELESENDGTNLTYSESFDGISKLSTLNQKLLTIPFSFSAKRKFKQQVKNIESYLINQE